MLASLVTRSTAIGFQLRNSVDIEVSTNNFRSVRGRPFALAILDECAFYMSENSATPDIELFKAIEPGMATLPNSMIIGISSPYRRSGLLFQKHKDHFGQDGDVLVIQAPTTTLNPTIDPAIVARALAEDPAAASAEWLGEFRSDIEAFVTREAIEAVTSAGVYERPFISGQRYYAFTDPSGGSSDSMTLSIAHLERGQIDSEKLVVVDAIREIRAPFSPEACVDEFANLLKTYHVSTVRGDRYAGEWPRERFRVHGIAYEVADKSKSDIYRDFLPIANSKLVDLLDHKRLFGQLVSLERRTARGGRDSIDHPPGAHDDVANAVAGVVVQVRAASNATRTRQVRVNFMGR
jgi:hypothetical protein